MLCHNNFIDFAEPEEKAENAEHFDILTQQGVRLSATVENFFRNAVTKLNERVLRDLQEITQPGRRGSMRSRGQRSSRYSSSSFSSKEQTCMLDAEKAQPALVFAEQEKKRRIEAEIKMWELERKRREVARMREVEGEELRGIIEPEFLTAETDHERAEARKAAAIMDLEAKVTAAMEGELVDDETSSSDESTPFSRAPTSSSGATNPQLITVTPVNTLGTAVSSLAIASGPNPPMLSSTTHLTLPYQPPFVKPSFHLHFTFYISFCEAKFSFTLASTQVPFTPVNTPGTAVSPSATASRLNLPILSI